MNTSKLADISEILSSIAILVTLIFLAIQMQHNTEALQTAARQNALASDVNYLYKLIDYPEVALAIRKPEMSDKEKIMSHYMLSSLFRMREHDWIQYKNGILDDITWSTYESTINLALSSPRARVWWKRVSSLVYEPGFIDHINGLIADAPVQEEYYALNIFD